MVLTAGDGDAEYATRSDLKAGVLPLAQPSASSRLIVRVQRQRQEYIYFDQSFEFSSLF